MLNHIRISTVGVASDYHQSLVPCIIKSLGYSISWTSTNQSDLIIFGPFLKKIKKNRWIPKPIRKFFPNPEFEIKKFSDQISLFHTNENVRYNTFPADFSLSFDLAVDTPNHQRLPYWMELVNWDHEGVYGIKNPRYGHPIELSRLMAPLGNRFQIKSKSAVLFASHLNEPRSTLFKAVSKVIPAVGYGPFFDHSIKDHNVSGFMKREIMNNFGFNLCPENSMYPGYYTEKIPEAFMGDCLPLTWTDANVSIDFNPLAFINLAPMMSNRFEELGAILTSKYALDKFSSQPLLHKMPTLEPIINFIKEILKKATT